jgi:hypothetical protein
MDVSFVRAFRQYAAALFTAAPLVAAGLVALPVVLGACIATETGNPSARPTFDPAVLEGQVLSDDPKLPGPPTLDLRGRAGSVDPPEGRVVVRPVESGGGPYVAEVAPDGSFDLVVHASPDSVLRLEIHAPDGARSLPFDVVVDSFDGLLPAARIVACFVVNPSSEQLPLRAAPGLDGTITVTNGCDGPLSRRPATPVNGDAAFAVSDDGPLDLDPGASATIRVWTTAEVTAGAEDIVRVDLLAPQVEIRAVSVFATP